jgi:hypothetical protein
MQIRIPFVTGTVSLLIALAFLSTTGAGCVPAENMGGTGGAGGASGAGTGSGGAGSGTGGASCTPGSTAGYANYPGVKEILHFYCGGSGCHNEGQAPKFFDDATLYATLTTYKVAGCGNRVLVKPCAPDDSALYLVPQGMCPMVEKMPKGCVDNCVVPDDLGAIRQWIANGAPMQ